MSDGFNLEEALDSNTATGALKTFLGIGYETHICDSCGAECRETTVYDPNTAAFGPTPAWECVECGAAFYREDRHEAHTGDLYDRE